ncbi:DUF945 family protein [Pseudomonas sp. NPDC007930]|uniref:YdgA family protein n=1 Tax=Pseudomonas sp. NPDC007930 TaxID=3364417 RepID=UPI0036ECF4C0
MNKIATLGAAVIIIAGAAITGGAWYTGTRIEPLLREQLVDLNQQLAVSLAGQGRSAQVALASFDRQLFSSDARYEVTVQSPQLFGGQRTTLNVAEHIEHGPFPWSRVKTLHLLPVMASSQFALQNSRELQGWFDLTQGVAPVTGQATLGYDQSLEAGLQALPLQWSDAQSSGAFSGLNVQVKGTQDGRELHVSGTLDNLEAAFHNREGEAHLQLGGVVLNSGGLKGQSSFYLGNSSVKITKALLQMPNKPALELNGFLGVGSLEEEGGKLKGSTDYTLPDVRVGGAAAGSAQMRWVFSNIDAGAAADLAKVYRETIEPQAQAAAAAGVPYNPQLTQAEQLQLQASGMRLLAGQPHIALENLGLKTANGESHLSLVLDLAKPADMEQPPLLLAQQLVSRLDAKLVLSKLTIQDLTTLQGQLQGETDAAALARNAEGQANLVATLATLQGVARVEGNDIRSDLHYENGQVDFNGQKMTLQQFLAFLMSKVAG